MKQSDNLSLHNEFEQDIIVMRDKNSFNEKFDIVTSHGEIEVNIEEPKEGVFIIECDLFYTEFLLIKCIDEKTSTNYLELRTKVGFVLIHVFENCDIDYNTIEKITNWITDNNY